MNADQGLFDSLHHAAAVVGLNTSAMIEAAIVGRPVFTIATDEFAAGQQGTLHYRYLLTDNGGVVSPSDSFDAHCRQLAAALAGDPQPGRSRASLRRGVRAAARPRPPGNADHGRRD